MDYFTKKIDQKINLAKSLENISDVKILLQVKIEYSLLFYISVLKNANFNSLPLEDREYIDTILQKPTVGDLANAISKLNKSNDKSTRKIVAAISKYPEVRNTNIGHGFVFNDGNKDFINKLEDLINIIYSGNILAAKFDYIYVINQKDQFYSGINFSYDSGIIPWKYPVNSYPFEKNCTYVLQPDNTYCPVIPYICITENEELFLYSKICDLLLGRVLYNQVFSTSQITKDWDALKDMSSFVECGRKICINKTVVNDFKKNYTKYFEVGIKEKVKQFLEKDKSTVACTIWGHGGVGKTAVIQSVIEEYEVSEKKVFDYIGCMSAKDRLYNYHNGKIEEIRERIDSFSDIITHINQVIGSENYKIDEIINVNGKILIVIDDLETFNKAEVEKIQDFIKQLDINKHKVVLTTRTNLIIGQEIKTNELTISETQLFLENIFTHDFHDETSLLSIKNDREIANKIHELTSGRPIFIYQLAFLILQRGIKYSLNYEIKKSETAVEFLYGRIYDYLSKQAKNIFVAIGQLIQSDDRTGSLNVIKYALDLENEEDIFSEGLDHLIKLRVVELTGDGIYRVYSNEILKIMKSYYSENNKDFPFHVFSKRIEQLKKSSANDVEKILLENANNARFTQSKDDVISNYENILSRESSPMEIQLEALVQLSSYLYNELADYDSTLELMKKNYSKFKEQPEFVQFYSSVSWASKLKDQAIKILEGYLKDKTLESSINVELFCSLAIKKSMYLIDKREEIKNSYDYDTSDKLRKIKKDFFAFLEEIGRPLIQHLYRIELNNLNDKQKQNYFTAIYHCIDIFCRTSQLIEILGHKNIILKKFGDNKEYYNKINYKFQNIENYQKQQKGNY